MNNYYYELYEEQQKTNEYLANIDSNIETIMQNNLFYQQEAINSLGLIASIIMIVVVFYCVFSLVLK